MVTAGANQAFVNVALALLDAGDVAVLLRPYVSRHGRALFPPPPVPATVLLWPHVSRRGRALFPPPPPVPA